MYLLGLKPIDKIGENCTETTKRSEESEKQRFNGALNSITARRLNLADINFSKTHYFFFVNLVFLVQKSEQKGSNVDEIFLFIERKRIMNQWSKLFIYFFRIRQKILLSFFNNQIFVEMKHNKEMVSPPSGNGVSLLGGCF